MKKVFFILALTTATLTSCSKNDSEVVAVGTNEEDKFLGTWKGEKTVVITNQEIFDDEEALILEECEKKAEIIFSKPNGVYQYLFKQFCPNEAHDLVYFKAENGEISSTGIKLLKYSFQSNTKLILEVHPNLFPSMTGYTYRWELTKQ